MSKPREIDEYAATAMEAIDEAEGKLVLMLRNLCRASRRDGPPEAAGIAALYEMEFNHRLDQIGFRQARRTRRAKKEAAA